MSGKERSQEIVGAVQMAVGAERVRAERFLKASTVARAVRQAVQTPADAHPTEIVLRPR